MSVRLTSIVTLIMAAAWLGGCGSSSAPSAPRSRTASGPAPTVTCGAPAAKPGLARPHQGRRLTLPGSPDGIATTPDGQTSFVAIQSGAPRVAVIADSEGAPRLLRTIAVPAYASGMRVTPDGRYALGAAGRGAVVLDVAAARSGSGRALLGELRAPARIAGHGPGAAEVAVAPDARHVFVTLEGAGVVAVFDLRAARLGASAGGAAGGLGASAGGAAGGLGASASGAAAGVGASVSGYLGAIPVGVGALGMSVSPDGRRLYEVSESAVIAGHRPGALNVIDLARALRTPRRAVIATAPAPCAPVRVAASPRGGTVWVTARDANALLGYSPAALVRDPARALASVTRVGPTPLGLAVVDSGRRVLVADGDLGDPRRFASAVSVVASGASPTLVATVASGRLADAIALCAAHQALVTDSDGHALQVLELSQLP